jgi:hypothetical protein
MRGGLVASSLRELCRALCPGRGAECNAAPQNRDHTGDITRDDPGSAKRHGASLAPHRVRDANGTSGVAPYARLRFFRAMMLNTSTASEKVMAK